MAVKTRLLFSLLAFFSAALAGVIGTGNVKDLNLTGPVALPATTSIPLSQPAALHQDDEKLRSFMSQVREWSPATETIPHYTPVKTSHPAPELSVRSPAKCEGDECGIAPFPQNKHPGCVDIVIERYSRAAERVWTVNVRENGKEVCDIKRECDNCPGGVTNCFGKNKIKWANNMVWYYSAKEEKEFFSYVDPRHDAKIQCGKFRPLFSFDCNK